MQLHFQNIKTLLVFPIILLLLCSCHKKQENSYSYWYVNSDSFATNETYVSEGDFKPRSDFATSSYNNGFWLVFSAGSLPTTGLYEVKATTYQSPYGIKMCFYYKGATYLISAFNTINVPASAINGKAHYSFPQAWYINATNPADSILVKAELTAP